VLRAALVDAAADVGPPDTLPLHLREAAPAVAALPDPRADGFEAFAGGLVAMARCGMLLTRADVVRGGNAMGLAVRVGDRKFLIRTLMGQDASRTLAWLAGEAEGWAARHGAMREMSPAIAGFWIGRARASAALLRSLSREAAEPDPSVVS
jgi:hypothetical protein